MYFKIFLILLIIIFICLFQINENENFQMNNKCLNLDKKDPIAICKNYDCCKENKMNQTCYCGSSFNKKCKKMHQTCLKELNYNDKHKEVCQKILDNCCEYQNNLFENVNDMYGKTDNKKSETSICKFTISDLKQDDCAKMCKFYPECNGYVYGDLLDMGAIKSIKHCSLLNDEAILIDTRKSSSYYKKK